MFLPWVALVHQHLSFLRHSLFLPQVALVHQHLSLAALEFQELRLKKGLCHGKMFYF
jgi:hypothetical protein